MKKILAVTVFLLVAACLIAPKFIAPKHQENLVALVNKLNEQTGYSANIVSTKTAWFGSENTVKVTLYMTQFSKNPLYGTLEAEFVIDSHYGPLLFSKQGLFGLFTSEIHYSGDKLRSSLTWNEDQPFYALAILGKFSGDMTLEDKIPEISNAGDTFQFSGYSGKGEISNRSISYESHVDQMDIIDGYTPIKTENFVVSYDASSEQDSLFNGGINNTKLNINVDKLSLGSDSELNGMRFDFTSNLDNTTELGELSIGYLVESAIFDDFTANDLTLTAQVTNLNNNFFTNFQPYVEDFISDSNSPDAEAEAGVAYLIENLDVLLQANPEFNIPNVSGTFSTGQFSGSLTSKLDDVESPSVEDIYNKNYWLYHTNLSANLEADAPLVRDLTERLIANKMRAPTNAPEVKQQALVIINSLVNKGLIALEDEKYKTDVSLQKGQASILENTFPMM